MKGRCEDLLPMGALLMSSIDIARYVNMFDWDLNEIDNLSLLKSPDNDESLNHNKFGHLCYLI